MRREHLLRRSQKDANHDQLKEAALRHAKRLGLPISWADTHGAGDGFPDAVLGWAGGNHLVEIKNPHAKGRLREGQKLFARAWTTPVHVVETQTGIIALLDSLLDESEPGRGGTE